VHSLMLGAQIVLLAGVSAMHDELLSCHRHARHYFRVRQGIPTG
jgi:hypothetical protein